MSTNGRARTGEPDVAASFSELTHDVIELAELQAKLFALDVSNTSQRTRTSLIWAVVGVCMLLGTIPVALFTLAELFVEQLGWSNAAGFGMATIIGALASASILVAAWLRFRTGLGTLQRSRDELSRNIAWIKSSLRSRGQTQPVEKN